MRHIFKPLFTVLVISLLASACSHKTGTSAPTNSASDTNKPQFTIGPSDLAAPAQIATNGVGSGHDTVVIHLQFSTGKSDEFRRFTRDHINQEVQILVGTNVVAAPHIMTEISGGKADLAFSSLDQAKAVADSLNMK
jgi:preprotein translocase subunit SecD